MRLLQGVINTRCLLYFLLSLQMTILSNRTKSKSNASNVVNTTTSTAPRTNGSNMDTKATSSPSSIKQPYLDSLMDNVKHLQTQSNETALQLSDKIDDLQEVNQALKAQVATLEDQLEEQRSKASKARDLMANRLNILEGYIQGGPKLEDQRIQENQQVQVLSQRNTDLINQRIDTVEEQLVLSFNEFEEKRSKELQLFVGTSKSLHKLCDDIRIKLNKQAQLTADHDKEIAINTETIRNTFSSEALASLEKGVRDALDMCESKLFKMEGEHQKMQTMLNEASGNFKIANDTIHSMQTKLDDLREDTRVEMAAVPERIGKLSQGILKTATKLGFEFDLQNPKGNQNNDGTPLQQTNDEDETF